MGEEAEYAVTHGVVPQTDPRGQAWVRKARARVGGLCAGSDSLADLEGVHPLEGPDATVGSGTASKGKSAIG